MRLLTAARAAIPYPATAATPSISLHIPPSIALQPAPAGSPVGLFPLDARLETAARQWAASNNVQLRQLALVVLGSFPIATIS